MKKFNFGRYLIRVVKYIIYYSLFILALLAIVYYTSDHQAITSFWELIRPESQRNLIILIVAFAAVYPFIGFEKKEVYTLRAFDKDKDTVMDIVKECGYVLLSDQDNIMTFRVKNMVTRIFRVFEDKLVLDYSSNPLIVEGMRKDIARLASHMEYHFRRMGNE